MKQTLLLLLTFISFLQLSAQVSLTPAQVIVPVVSPDSAQVIGYGRVKNNVDENKTYRWIRTVRSLSNDWETAVCDTNLCYLPNVDSADFDLGPMAEANMDVYIYPMGNTGSAVVEVQVIDLSNTDNVANAVYYFNTEPSSVKRRDRYKNIKVYPNPTNGIFQITDNEISQQVTIFNMVGRQVQSFSYVPGDRYDLSHLPRGTYLVQLQDRSGLPIVTRLLNKL